MGLDAQPKRRGRPPSGGREAILEAALALVREEGAAKLTSRNVAARAGVSDASVYYHFGDRAGLLRAAYAHGMKPLELLSDPSGRERTELLASTFAALEQFFDDVLPVLHAAQADPEIGATLAAYVEENDLGPHQGVGRLSAYLKSEQDAGRVNPAVDTEAVALLLIDAAYSRAGRRQMLHADEDDTRLPSVQRLLATFNQLLDPPDADA